MDTPNYGSNSHKSKDSKVPEKKVEKAITGSAKLKKKSGLRKFFDTFVSEDATSVKTYIWAGVLIPTIQKALSDIVKNGIDIILYGDSGRSKKDYPYSRVSYSGYRNYGDYYDKSSNRRDYSTSGTYHYDEVIIDTRAEAEEVLVKMDDLISKYGQVTVADLYDLVGISCDYTDNKYGWTDIHSAKAERVRDGWVLRLPKATALD